MRTSTLPRFHPFTAFPLFSVQNCDTNWLITVTAPRFSTFWLAPLMVSPLVLMHLGLLYGRLSTTCAPSSSILTLWTSIWLPKSPRGALRDRFPTLLLSPSLAARSAGSQEWSTRKLAASLGTVVRLSAPSHLIRLTGNSVAIYSSGWSFYHRGMGSVFFAYRQVVPSPIYLSPWIPMEPTVL